jgi:DinB superfamily
MTVIERIVGQMKAAFEGGAWHGPAVLELLQDVDPITAMVKPIPEAHSIWELVAHLTATADVIHRRIGGEQAGLKEEEFWPGIAARTESNWRAAVAELVGAESRLRAAVASFPEARLDEPLMAGSANSAYTTFHGHIQHSLYHAGQIALLKKKQEGIPF